MIGGYCRVPQVDGRFTPPEVDRHWIADEYISTIGGGR